MSAPFDGHAIYARDDYERISKYFASRTACEEAFEETVKKLEGQGASLRYLTAAPWHSSGTAWIDTVAHSLT